MHQKNHCRKQKHVPNLSLCNILYLRLVQYAAKFEKPMDEYNQEYFLSTEENLKQKS